MISGDGSFHIGDKVVYPNHGVGIIEQISSRTIGASVEKFYLLKIKASSLKVMVPFHNVNSVGLRRVVRNGEIQKILDFLTDGECENNADWKYRFKENSERMRTGSLLEVAAVLKGLLLLTARRRRYKVAALQISRIRLLYRRPWFEGERVAWPALA